MSPDKRALRVALRRARAAYGPAAIRLPEAFCESLTPGLIVASYVPIGSEADPAPLVAAAVAAGCRLALPHVVDRRAPMRYLAHDATAPLVSGPFGLSQPPENAEAAVPEIILTPLVGFDRHGARLGQGAGHYDRAFALYPKAWRIGIALACQEVEALPTDAWDMPLHAIATDKEWIVP